jgi:cysteinyl-tRNA synthetase
MRAMIERLVAKGHAYVAEEHVLFHVPSMPDYGRLSGRSTDELIAGARVEVAPYKRNPMDFVLWKPSKEGEPAWDSPAGIQTPGRPGWHIACSAMAKELLGETFDIHGGGVDLVFPHHENEIAQSRCAHGTELMARCWLHNGYLQVEGAKMSKSLGNFVLIRDLLETETFGGRSWPGEVLRLAMLRTHYRQPLDWTAKGLEEAAEILRSWGELVERLQADVESEPSKEIVGPLLDDLNTPSMIAQMHEYARHARQGDIKAATRLRSSALLLGLNPAAWFGARSREAASEAWAMSVGIDKKIKTLISIRAKARKRKDFAEADRIRAELEAMGIQLKDSKDPQTGEPVTTWELKR